MFAVEIYFKDTKDKENFIVKRPVFSIGAGEHNHLVVKDFENLDFEILVSQEYGTNFRCQQVDKNNLAPIPKALNEVYSSYAKFNLGNLKIIINSVDNDLRLKPNEALDVAGLRILNEAIDKELEKYPAFRILNSIGTVISFRPDQEVYAGRSSECVLRFDARDVSSIHAKLGITNNKFWIEDLGSTNGTFINDEQISGRREFGVKDIITLGGSIKLQGLLGPDTKELKVSEVLETGNGSSSGDAKKSEDPPNRYPILISLSDLARPARLVLVENKPITIGRDQSSEFWIGAPFISRKHCRITFLNDLSVEIQDQSTNGTAYLGGLLKDGAATYIKDKPEILHFGSGLSVAICFNEEDEKKFLETKGALNAFNNIEVIDNNLAPENLATSNVNQTIRQQVLDTVADLDLQDDTLYGGNEGGFGYYLAVFQALTTIKKVLFILLFLLLVAIFVIILSIIIALLD